MSTDSGYWKPAVYKDSTLTELPRPVLQLAVNDSWDMRESKVPLDDGISITGVSRNGVVIAVSGELAAQPEGTELGGELAMFDAWKSLRDVLNIDDDTEKFEFFIYHDATAGVYRKFKNCFCRSMGFDNGDNSRVPFPYSLEIVSEDPTVYTTAPGS